MNRTLWFIVIFLTLVIIVLLIYCIVKSGKKSRITRGKTDLVSDNETERVYSYLSALYPFTNWDNESSDVLIDLYDSFNWYYLPLVREIPQSRREPLKGPFIDSETQWFVADGADCGKLDVDDGFICSVFSQVCHVWEYGKGGRPYQAIQFNKPYSGDGVPNNAYIESVSFVCEGMGRKLLNVECKPERPDWKDYLNNPKAGLVNDWNVKEGYQHRNCPNKEGCDGNDPGCQYRLYGSVYTTCCWDDDKKQPDSSDSVCGGWPSQCAAKEIDGQVVNPTCFVPCTYENCHTSENCDWIIDDTNWYDWLKNQHQPHDERKASYIVNKILYSKPHLLNGEELEPVKPVPDINLQASMFYWIKGYGKFLNVGKTGVYFNFIHFLLTCPKYDLDGKSARWSFPQIFQTSVLHGKRILRLQLIYLMSGHYHDERKYLEGFVTTLRGRDYEGYGNGVEEVKNHTNYTTENVNGMVNPLDDDNLRRVHSETVTKYYPPESKIKNPQYRKRLKYTPLQSVNLLQGMHIYGATSSSTEHSFVISMTRTPGHYGAGTLPFGVRYSGVELDNCVFQTVKRLGWDSLQLTRMPTGSGSKKYCSYPEYDYELVYVKYGPKDTCKKGFKFLDPTKDWNNYFYRGFVQGTGDEEVDEDVLGLRPFDPRKMKLTERNVPDDWVGPLPNETLYLTPPETILDTSKCPYKDNVYNPYRYKHAGGINPGINSG